MPAWEIAAATALMVLFAALLWLTIHALTTPVHEPRTTDDNRDGDQP